jgi:hypothetical protein
VTIYRNENRQLSFKLNKIDMNYLLK